MSVLFLTWMFVCSGCSITRDGGQFLADAGRRFDQVLGGHESPGGSAALESGEIANPLAKSIRFDGQETILGLNHVTLIAEDEFSQRLAALLHERRFGTASRFVLTHIDTAHQVMWSRWATQEQPEYVRFIAKTVSRDCGPTASWIALLEHAAEHPQVAGSYRAIRSDFQTRLESNEPIQSRGDSLQQAADQMGQPLARIDALRLLALHEAAQGRHAWAQSLLLQAIKMCEQHEDHYRAADLRLLLSIASVRSGSGVAEAAAAWETAVTQHARAQLASESPIRTAFWIRAGENKPARAEWPEEARRALLPSAKSLGCRFENDSPTETIVWSAVGNAELKSSKAQMALIHFKKAETLVRGDDQLWLRVAQGECLASLGQTQAASAVLGGPMASENQAIAAAANAALGSAKLQNGAFHQGVRLLNRALSDPAVEWPKRAEAEADLALAHLIMGDTERGLRALHAVQRKFEISGNVAALLQSLENEIGLLEHEQKPDALAKVRQRLLVLESEYLR